MAENTNFFNDIRDKIIEGNIKEALTKFNSWSMDAESYLSDEIAQLLARYNSNERSNNLGNISNTDYEIEKNKITKAGLVLLDEAKHPEVVYNNGKSGAKKSTPRAYATDSNIYISSNNQTQRNDNAALAFVKKNMLWIGIALVAALILFFVLKPPSDIVQDPNSPTYETKQQEPSTDNTKQQDQPTQETQKKY